MREPLHPGSVIDGYRLGECIHQGGTGAIYRATGPRGREPGFPLVFKVPYLGPGESALGIVSLEMEQTVLARLTGPHVPRFVAAGDIRAMPYVVMEWIEGTSVAQYAAKAPLAPEEVARIGAALADAVHSVHLQEVIHFDLKPENFMLRPSGEAVLLDFGFARHARYPDLLAEERQFAAGSSAYVSPEQLQGNRSDERSDLFALGVLLYELATGTQPFGDPQTYTGMRDRLWRVPSPPRAVNAGGAPVAAGDHSALPGTGCRSTLPIGRAHRLRSAPSATGRARRPLGEHPGHRRSRRRSAGGGAPSAATTQARRQSRDLQSTASG